MACPRRREGNGVYLVGLNVLLYDDSARRPNCPEIGVLPANDSMRINPTPWVASAQSPVAEAWGIDVPVIVASGKSNTSSQIKNDPDSSTVGPLRIEFSRSS